MLRGLTVTIRVLGEADYLEVRVVYSINGARGGVLNCTSGNALTVVL